MKTPTARAKKKSTVDDEFPTNEIWKSDAGVDAVALVLELTDDRDAVARVVAAAPVEVGAVDDMAGTSFLDEEET